MISSGSKFYFKFNENKKNIFRILFLFRLSVLIVKMFSLRKILAAEVNATWLNLFNISLLSICIQVFKSSSPFKNKLVLHMQLLHILISATFFHKWKYTILSQIYYFITLSAEAEQSLSYCWYDNRKQLIAKFTLPYTPSRFIQSLYVCNLFSFKNIRFWPPKPAALHYLGSHC